MISFGIFPYAAAGIKSRKENKAGCQFVVCMDKQANSSVNFPKKNQYNKWAHHRQGKKLKRIMVFLIFWRKNPHQIGSRDKSHMEKEKYLYIFR